MRLVDEHPRPVALRNLEDLGEGADVAVHRVDAFDDHQLLALDPRHLALEVHRVVVPEEHGLGLGQDRAVDDGGVGVLVEEDRVPGAHEGGDEAHVGAVARREDDAGFLVLEGRELLGEPLVDLEGPGEDRGARGPQAVGLDGLCRRPLDLGAVGDPEVVVRGEVEEVLQLLRLPVAHPDMGGRRAGKRFLVEVVPVGEGLAVPVREGGQEVEGVVPGAVVEIGVVVLGKARFVRLCSRLHRRVLFLKWTLVFFTRSTPESPGRQINM